MEHIEAENSEEIDDGMNFGDLDSKLKNDNAKTSKIKVMQTNDNKPIYQKGMTMYINGRPIMVDKGSQALNKREASNWLIHILFIRQDYTECIKFIDELLVESERKNDSQRSEYAIYLKALVLRIKG